MTLLFISFTYLLSGVNSYQQYVNRAKYISEGNKYTFLVLNHALISKYTFSLMRKTCRNCVVSDDYIDYTTVTLPEVIVMRKELQDELYIIQAITLRNEAQLGSFVDEKAQWLAQSQYDRDMLSRRTQVESRLEIIDQLLDNLGPSQ